MKRVSCTMMSRRACRERRRNAARRSHAGGTRSTRCPTGRRRTRGSTPWRGRSARRSPPICAATVSSICSRGSGGGASVAVGVRGSHRNTTGRARAAAPGGSACAVARPERALVREARERGGAVGGPRQRAAVDVQVPVVVEQLRAPVEGEAVAARRPRRTGPATAAAPAARRTRAAWAPTASSRGSARPAPASQRMPASIRVHWRRIAGADARRHRASARGRGRRSGRAGRPRRAGSRGTRRRARWRSRRGIRSSRSCRRSTAMPSCANCGGRYSMSPGPEHVVALGNEPPQDLDRQPGAQREVVLAAVAPAPSALALQQEHVVGVEVRADAAAGRGVAHHQVVEPRVGHEREAAQQRVGRVAECRFDALHQQRPVALGQRLPVAARERAVRERPRRAVAHDQPRLDVVALGEGAELPRA